MTIHRRDKWTDESERQALGRIEVNIDDLDALLGLLRDYYKNGQDTVEADFDEGTFEEASDLRHLSAINLRDISVKALGVTVHLSDSRTEAIGSRHLVELVYRAWVRSRKTRRWPNKRVSIQRSIIWGTVACIVVMFGLVLLFPTPSNVLVTADPTRAQLPWLVGAVGIVGTGLLTQLVSRIHMHTHSSYAIIDPRTREEIRRFEQSRTRQPVWSLVIAILPLVASVTFTIITLLRPGR